MVKLNGVMLYVPMVRYTEPISEVEGGDSNAVDWNSFRRLGSSWLREIRISVSAFYSPCVVILEARALALVIATKLESDYSYDLLSQAIPLMSI
jgi:hypothetical protein